MNEEARSRPDAPILSEPLSWEAIRRRYPDQWVAVVDMEWIDDTDEFRTARVAGHGPRRTDPLLQTRILRDRYDEIGHFFTGKIRATAGLTFAP